ncbi:polysaccharide biosynthesis protein [Flavilitoribacter nigricans]|nr:nucleoside-diphosphate sugar epimerase/dehydratase [Flavilitoribacter nigricans]
MISKISQKTLKTRPIAGYVTKSLILGFDLLFSFLSFLLAVLIIGKFDLDRASLMWGWALPILMAFRLAAFISFRTFSIIIRYIGEKDVKNLFYAVVTSSSLFLGIQILFPKILPEGEALSIITVDALLLLAFAVFFRVLLRLVFNQLRDTRKSRLNTVIFGAGEMGAILERVLRSNSNHNYRPVAFFDDNTQVHKKLLNGLQVFNPRKSFASVIKKYDVKVAIIGINQLPEERRIEFINDCLEHKVKVLKAPPTEVWLNDKLKLGQLQDIRFEDLLNREPIKLNEIGISRSISGKVVLVTGCAGSIGSEIVRQLLRYDPRMIVGLDQAETPLAEIGLALKHEVQAGRFKAIIGSVCDDRKLREVFERYQPEYVFHAAAYKHVPIMETFPEEAVKTNIHGTQCLADLSAEYGVRKFVMISTDKVVNPSNVMGASKRIAEIYVQSLNYVSRTRTQFITTRFGNVLGSNGSVIPIFKKQIENREPVTVTHEEVTRFFMTIPEACQLVLEAGVMGKGGEIFIFDMGKPVRIVDLARKMIQMAGLTPGKDIEIKFTGLRPGEKLREELLDEQEGLIPTHHPKIRKAAVRQNDHETMKEQILFLIELARDGHPRLELVRQMKAIVPEFTSQNSAFSKLDTSEKVI